ncbi:MAG TPA: hypothetical protein VJB57_06445 [Dehalococcoidia bacterium]|nr:hypothetical protein [Dehalococcoidia bacterium]
MAFPFLFPAIHHAPATEPAVPFGIVMVVVSCPLFMLEPVDRTFGVAEAMAPVSGGVGTEPVLGTSADLGAGSAPA